ncbi:Epimerase domain-containing protein [Mycena sanguinolenta]|uniref:Epimerase domain-containing protein n=1 Tax=Mycena sanguinolenta TaxID=230812 RepID=A0A8H7CTG2_9AGAR|nr:Epimerase domain-containing protein [Mycena sanguinolenta]
MSAELVFVTGASGFLGSHVVLQLLEQGYRVRAAARGTKADHLKSSYASYGDRFESIKITDIAHDQFPEALVGVDAIIHVASPLPGRAEPATILEAAIDGTLNVVVQGEKAGVRRVVVTSSIATVMGPTNSFTDQDWNPVTKEMALDGGNDMQTYSASKKFAEIALWEWAEKHPHVEVTTRTSILFEKKRGNDVVWPSQVNPTFFYGPFTAHFHVTPQDFGALSTDVMIYNLLFKDGVFPYFTRYIDVRDVAQAHVRALNSRPTAEVGRKRIVFSAPYGWSFQQILDLIAEKRPALKGRLIVGTPQEEPFHILPMDFRRVEEVLGMKKSDFYSIEETMLDTVDSLIEMEEHWRSTGRPIQTPPGF